MAWLRDVDRWFIDEVLPHRAVFRRHATRLVSPGEAEDLVQEAYARAIDASHHREIANARGFVLTIIRNLAFERHRRAAIVRIEHLADLGALEIADAAPDQFAVLSGTIELGRLMALLDMLPQQQRAVVKLRRIEGMPPKDIAVRLGLSISTVEKHLAKGLAMLASALQETPTPDEGVTVSTLWRRHQHQRN
ncbi:MAG: RNA polymerase sigma factor [Sphingopyxis sp.]|nr:RNA polymerase sigma factor [Sphingopyxis sp.]